MNFKEIRLCINLSEKNIQLLINLVSIMVLTIVTLYTYNNHKRYDSLFPEPNYELKTLGNFIQKNTTYNDILFSSTIKKGEHAWKGPQLIAYTMKNIYKVDTLKDIYEFLESKNISSDYTIKIIENKNSEKLSQIKSISKIVKSKNNYTLYSLDKKSFF